MKTTVVFVHGFTGGTDTWADFPDLLKADPELTDFTFLTHLYSSELNPLYLFTKYIWVDDPTIETIGQSLRTFLKANTGPNDRLMLIGHSMGGLAIQTFVIEEVGRGSHEFLDRLTEVILCGTPSGGLMKAKWGSFLKNQIADMNAHGPFIEKLRAAWKMLVDDVRSNPARLAKFRLTPIAGEKDKFVPQETSLDPFPYDEKFVVPGDHVSMVKPAGSSDVIYRIISQRIRSSSLTVAELNFVAETEAALMSRVIAARDLGDAEALLAMAGEVNAFPGVQRELGLALLAAQQYPESAHLLRSYLDSPVQKARPVVDVEAVQQLSIALSGAGKAVDAIAVLKNLPVEMQNDPETQGIMAGRIKRQWLKSPNNASLGWRAFDLYKAAFQTAQKRADHGQVIYNGINLAYMNYVLGGAEHAHFGNEVLNACAAVQEPDYWTLASKAEAELLLDRIDAAEATYLLAQQKAPASRHWSTTGQQALDICRRKGLAATKIHSLFANIGPA